MQVRLQTGRLHDHLDDRITCDTWRLVAAEGEVLSMVAWDITSPQMLFRYGAGSVDEHAQRWCAAGPSHHIVGAYGRWAEGLRKLASFMQIEMVSV